MLLWGEGVIGSICGHDPLHSRLDPVNWSKRRYAVQLLFLAQGLPFILVASACLLMVYDPHPVLQAEVTCLYSLMPDDGEECRKLTQAVSPSAVCQVMSLAVCQMCLLTLPMTQCSPWPHTLGLCVFWAVLSSASVISSALYFHRFLKQIS